MHRRAGLWAAGIAALMLNQADAASYYVSAEGNDSNSGLSADAPFRTPERAVSALADGDSIFFRAGDSFVLSSPIIVERSGTSTQHIVIGAYKVDGSGVSHRVSSERPILDGNKEAPALKSYSGLVHVSGRYVEVRDLVLKNSGGMGIRFQGTSDGWVDNVKTEWSYHQGIQAFKSSNISIKNCDVTGFGQGGKYYGESAYPNGVSVRTAKGVHVQGCVVHEGWGEGINSYYGSRDVVIENNLVYATRNVGIYVDSTQNADVRNNIVLGTADSLYHRYSDRPFVGPGIALNNETYQYEGSLTEADAGKNVRIYNNLVAGSAVGFAIWGQYSAASWDGIVVANNTFVDNDVQISVHNTSYTSVKIINNIFMSISSGSSDWAGAIDSSGIEWQSNYWSQGQPDAAASVGDVYEGLVLSKMAGWRDLRSPYDVSWEDFMPVSGSSTIGAGLDSVLSIVVTDFSGKARVSPPDIGGLQAGATGPAGVTVRKPKAPGPLTTRVLE